MVFIREATQVTQTANPLLRRGTLAAACLVIVAVLAFPAGSTATVTIGSNLGRDPGVSPSCTDVCTNSQFSLGVGRQAPGGLTSPVNGTVVLWRISVGVNTEATSFRVIRPLGGNLFTGAGTSATVTPPLNAITPYQTQLPIGIGDRIGLNCCDPGFLEAFADAMGTMNSWTPILADGPAGRPPDFTPTFEVLVNADIEPTSAFTIDKAKPKGGGKVKVTATLPNAGSLVAGPKGKKLLKSTTSQITAPGGITLTLKPTKAAKKQLRSRKRPKVKVKLTFTPTSGTAATNTVKVKLKS
jgi:hypothetical protein